MADSQPTGAPSDLDRDFDLDLDTLGDGIGRAATVLRANAGAAGLDAPVPTCPGWTVRDLIAHQGGVHRWATSHIAAQPISRAERQDAIAKARAGDDILGWFDEGATALLQAIVDAPDDLEAMTFLNHAGPPKHFWTRRQCHETTIHAVDALAARLGRAPSADETWISDAIALDGIDELLRGFVTQEIQEINPATPTTVRVAPDGSERAWLVACGPDAPPAVTVVSVVDGAGPAAYDSDREITGHPVDVYLQLWNRSPEPDAWWHEHVTI